jgi:uncharacterized PurR-regulated membrane protein YhhQ (DUF165 family)
MLWLGAFIGTVFAANWAVETFDLVPVGFGLIAPAGVYCAGFAFTFRDLVQDRLGRWWVLIAIITGATLSALVSSRLAIASSVAFLLSELLDFAVYTPLRSRGWLLAVAASNVVGLAADSSAFLLLAFGSLSFLPGQIVGKLWTTVVAVAALAAWRHRWPAGI